MAAAAIAAALAWLGPRTVGNFLVAFADALEAVRTPAVVQVRPRVVASLVADGFAPDEADEAVSESAQGPRTFHAWRGRAVQVLRAA